MRNRFVTVAVLVVLVSTAAAKWARAQAFATPYSRQAIHVVQVTSHCALQAADPPASGPSVSLPYAVEPPAGSRIQFVTSQGNDRASGRSWGNAKATIAAAAAHLTHGGTIYVAAGQYTLPSTGIVISKPIAIRCAPGSASHIIYTGAGVAITLAYGGGQNGSGVYNCYLTGPGSTTSATAIQVGTAGQGTANTQIRDVTIGTHATPSQGFGRAVAINPNHNAGSMVTVQIFDPSFQANGTGIYIGGTENTQIYGGLIAENKTGLYLGTNAWETNIYATSFDSNFNYAVDLESSNLLLNLFGVHFEDNTITGYTDYIHFGAAHSTVNMHGGDFLEDATAGSRGDFVNVAGTYSTFNAFGTMVWSRGETVAEFVNFSGTGSGGMVEEYNEDPQRFTKPYVLTASNTTYSHVIYIPLDNAGNKPAATFQNVNIYTNAGSVLSGGVLGLGNLTSQTTWSRGTKPPSGSCHDGSLFSNVNGTSGSTLYVCVAGAWRDIR